MIGNFFAPLAAKVLGGLSLALLIVVGVMGLKLHHANSTIEKQGLVLKAVSAERDRYRDAAQRQVDAGIEREARGQSAVQDHAGVSADLQRQAEKIRTVRVVVHEKCPTPKEVLGATGL